MTPTPRNHHRPPGEPLSEKALLARVRLVLHDIGATTYQLTQTRPSRVARGIPDLYVLHGKVGGFWVETKGWHGKQSPAQVAFQHACQLAAVDYLLVRSVDDLVAYLQKRHLL